MGCSTYFAVTSIHRDNKHGLCTIMHNVDIAPPNPYNLLVRLALNETSLFWNMFGGGFWISIAEVISFEQFGGVKLWGR